MDKNKLNQLKTFFQEQYPHIRRMALPDEMNVDSCRSEPVKMATTYNNQINRVINCCSRNSQTVLTTLYVEELSNKTCMERLGYGSSNYYKRIKPSAFVEFMERMKVQYPDTIDKILAN